MPLGWAPRASQSRMRSSSSTIVDGFVWALYCPTVSMTRPSRGERWSATGAGLVPLNTELRDTIRYLNNPPIFRVHASGTAQTLPIGPGVWTPITWTGESVDNYGMWSSGASVTCQRAGVYYIAGLAAVTETATKAGYRACRIHHTIAAGGSADYTGTSAMPMTGTKTTGTTLLADAFIRLAVGDTLQLQFDHTNGSALSVLGTSVTAAARMIGVWTAK